MSFLDLYMLSLQRERERAISNQRAIAAVATRIQRKQGELGRAKSSSRQRHLHRELDRLFNQRAQAEKALATQQKRIADLAAKVAREERREQQQDARSEERFRRELQSGLASTSTAIGELQARVSGLEDVMLERLRAAVAADPVDRQHDVFLSHASPDKEVAGELFAELTGRGLDVWFDAELHLGESLTRQIDRGIASSRIGVVLLTSAFLEGRYWTEREIGGLLATRRRVIPVLDGVTFADLSRYSPLLADLVGLSTETDGLDGIAERIATALVETKRAA